MKKVLWLIVCLMTMVIGFTSCGDSTKDDTPNVSINGVYLNAFSHEYKYIKFLGGETNGVMVSSNNAFNSITSDDYQIFNFSINGNKLRIYDPEYNPKEYIDNTFLIVELSATALKLQLYECNSEINNGFQQGLPDSFKDNTTIYEFKRVSN
jgi:hypothetical protein